MSTVFQAGVPRELRGASILLHPFEDDCVTPDYLSWLRDAEVLRYSNQRFREHTRETSLRYAASFRQTPNDFLVIRLQGDGRMVGTMTAYVAPPHGTADLGILIGDRSCWGRGIGLDAWRTLMEHLLVRIGLRKVTGGTLRCNVAMTKVMERSGMHLEATRIGQELVDGIPQDALYYAKFSHA